MGIARMQKVRILFHGSLKDKLLEELQNLGLLQVVSFRESYDGTEYAQFLPQEVATQEVESELSDLRFAADFLKGVEKKEGFLSGLGGKFSFTPQELEETLKSFDWRGVVKRCRELERERSQLGSQLGKAKGLKEQLQPWVGLDIPLEDARSTPQLVISLGTLPRDDLPYLETSLREGTDRFHLELVGRDGNWDYSLLVYFKEEEEGVEEVLKGSGWSQVSFSGLEGKPGEILANLDVQIADLSKRVDQIAEKARELAGYRTQLLALLDERSNHLAQREVEGALAQTSQAYMLEGWVKRKDIRGLRRALEARFDAFSLSSIDPLPGETPPVELENRPLIKPFEVVTELYGRPAYFELDPSPLLAIFFAVFFGLCLTDAGYGLVLSILALVMMRFLRGGRKFLWLMFAGGIFTIVEGALMGGWFGDLFQRLPLPFLGGFRASLMAFDPMVQPMIFFRLALLLGVVQVYFGLIIRLYENLREKKVADAIFDQLLWIILLSQLLLALFSSQLVVKLALAPKVLISPRIMGLPMKASILLVAGLIIGFSERGEKNVVFRLFLGFLHLFILGGIFSYLGDVLSYIRLMALGLVTAGIAVAVNSIAFMFSGIPYLGIVIMVIILALGHIFNLGINVLGGFVHTLRLQYVEFFQKFFRGGGKAFNPFRKQARYITVKSAD